MSDVSQFEKRLAEMAKLAKENPIAADVARARGLAVSLAAALQSKLEKLKVAKGDVVVLKVPTSNDMPNYEVVEGIKQALEGLAGGKVGLLVIPEDFSVSRWPAEAREALLNYVESLPMSAE